MASLFVLDKIFSISDNLRQTINIKSIIIILEVIYMKELFIKSLQMIKILGVNSQSDYEFLTRDFLILSSESLRYMAQKDSFEEIVKMANEM